MINIKAYFSKTDMRNIVFLSIPKELFNDERFKLPNTIDFKIFADCFLYFKL